VLRVGWAAFSLCIESCRRCIEAGVFAPTDPERLAKAMWAMEHGYADLALTQRGGILGDPDSIVDAVVAAARPRARETRS
jgi:hypothetical protein